MRGLFVVKNRLPPSLEHLPPEPLLSEEEPHAASMRIDALLLGRILVAMSWYGGTRSLQDGTRPVLERFD